MRIHKLSESIEYKSGHVRTPETTWFYENPPFKLQQGVVYIGQEFAYRIGLHKMIDEIEGMEVFRGQLQPNLPAKEECGIQYEFRAVVGACLHSIKEYLKVRDNHAPLTELKRVELEQAKRCTLSLVKIYREYERKFLSFRPRKMRKFVKMLSSVSMNENIEAYEWYKHSCPCTLEYHRRRFEKENVSLKNHEVVTL